MRILDGLLGFSQYPFAEFDEETDGIVVDYQAFGTMGTVEEPFHLGKTATHEIGHWLGLPHLWGIYSYNEECMYDDFVDDTPRQSAPNWYCGPWTTTCDGVLDMLHNYMNYSQDICNVFFTKGQSKRMRATLQAGGFRYPLRKSEAGCSYPAN